MNKLDAQTIFESNGGNKYVHDSKTRQTVLCPPILYFLLCLKQTGTEPELWFRQWKENFIEIDNYGQASRAEIRYYLNKYSLLRKNGFFGTLDHEAYLNAVMTAEDVKRNLANAKIVTFETTDKCNLKCAYCGYGKFYDNYDRRSNKNLDFKVAKRLLTYLQDLWNSPLNCSHDRNIYIGFYGGEPLLNFPLIEEIVHYLENSPMRHNRFSFSMTTNALLINKYMDFLAEHNFNLLISLDGDEDSNGYRVLKSGKPAYNRILENVLALKIAYPDYFQNKINFNAVLHNKNSVTGIFHFFKNNFSKYPSISPLNTTGIKESLKETFWKTYSNLEESLYKSEDYSMIQEEMFIKLPNIEGLSTFLARKTDFYFDTYNELLHATDEAVRFPTGTCSPFTKKIFVTVNGNILPCERIGQTHSLGAVNAQAVHIDCEAIAQKYNSWLAKLRNNCNKCYNIDLCTQCIFNLDIEKRKPGCKGFINHRAYSQYLSSYLSFLEREPKLYKEILTKVFVE
ncbi:MAG TPA: radical SAM peptide maturase [Candidatus Deferrimicrobium sp.]|nr:radical SAM peptide maturase [Candidatus Deferrimicrobium sp.]